MPPTLLEPLIEGKAAPAVFNEVFLQRDKRALLFFFLLAALASGGLLPAAIQLIGTAYLDPPPGIPQYQLTSRPVVGIFLYLIAICLAPLFSGLSLVYASRMASRGQFERALASIATFFLLLLHLTGIGLSFGNNLLHQLNAGGSFYFPLTQDALRQFLGVGVLIESIGLSCLALAVFCRLLQCGSFCPSCSDVRAICCLPCRMIAAAAAETADGREGSSGSSSSSRAGALSPKRGLRAKRKPLQPSSLLLRWRGISAFFLFFFILLCNAALMPPIWNTGGLAAYFALKSPFAIWSHLFRFSGGQIDPLNPLAWNGNLYVKLYEDSAVYFGFLLSLGAVAVAVSAWPRARSFVTARRRFLPCLPGCSRQRLGASGALLQSPRGCWAKSMLLLNPFPQGLTVGEAFLVLSYLGLNAYWLQYWGFRYSRIAEDSAAMQDSLAGLQNAARVLAHMSTLNLSFLTLPLSRSNSLFEAVFGASFERAVRYHRLLGGICWLFVTAHASCWWVKWSQQGILWSNVFTIDALQIAPGPLGFRNQNFTIPLVQAVWLMMTLTLILAVLCRRRNYELFHYTHHVSWLFIIIGFLHAWAYWIYAAGGALLYFMDKLTRAYKAGSEVRILSISNGAGVTRLVIDAGIFNGDSSSSSGGSGRGMRGAGAGGSMLSGHSRAAAAAAGAGVRDSAYLGYVDAAGTGAAAGEGGGDSASASSSLMGRGKAAGSDSEAHQSVDAAEIGGGEGCLARALVWLCSCSGGRSRRPQGGFYAGQFVYLNVPGLSVLQYHPFTISSPPSQAKIEGTFTLHIKDQGPHTWTDGLARMAHIRPSCADLIFSVDGPYGRLRSYSDKHSLILIAGGMGITPLHSIVSELHMRATQPEVFGTVGALRRVQLVWASRQQQLFAVFADTLALLHEAGGVKRGGTGAAAASALAPALSKAAGAAGAAGAGAGVGMVGAASIMSSASSEDGSGSSGLPPLMQPYPSSSAAASLAGSQPSQQQQVQQRGQGQMARASIVEEEEATRLQNDSEDSAFGSRLCSFEVQLHFTTGGKGPGALDSSSVDGDFDALEATTGSFSGPSGLPAGGLGGLGVAVGTTAGPGPVGAAGRGGSLAVGAAGALYSSQERDGLIPAPSTDTLFTDISLGSALTAGSGGSAGGVGRGQFARGGGYAPQQVQMQMQMQRSLSNSGRNLLFPASSGSGSSRNINSSSAPNTTNNNNNTFSATKTLLGKFSGGGGGTGITGSINRSLNHSSNGSSSIDNQGILMREKSYSTVSAGSDMETVDMSTFGGHSAGAGGGAGVGGGGRGGAGRAAAVPHGFKLLQEMSPLDAGFCQPENATKLLSMIQAGRPNLRALLLRAVQQAKQDLQQKQGGASFLPRNKISVLVCGPAGLVTAVSELCFELDLDFQSVSFEW